MLAGLLGILFGGFAIQFPAYITWNAPGMGPIFPILFITVACGACSGFHSLVASGTTSKQIDKESHARTVGYGAMLVEGLVAVIALATVMMAVQSDDLKLTSPTVVYAKGLSQFAEVLGVPPKIGFSFGLLAVSTFILTTLDTATRLGRYIFEEFFQIRGGWSRYAATLATLALPLVFALIELKDANGNPLPAWKAIWPVFGATNQLLAGLTLLVLIVYVSQVAQTDRVPDYSSSVYDDRHTLCPGAVDWPVQGLSDRRDRIGLAVAGRSADHRDRPGLEAEDACEHFVWR